MNSQEEKEQKRIQSLKESGIFEAYECLIQLISDVLEEICIQGFPRENVFEFAASAVKRYSQRKSEMEKSKSNKGK